jgi:hypothetical protein
VAVTDPLPGGCQTLIVDCAGAQLSYIMGDTIRLFRVRGEGGERGGRGGGVGEGWERRGGGEG